MQKNFNTVRIPEVCVYTEAAVKVRQFTREAADQEWEMFEKLSVSPFGL